MKKRQLEKRLLVSITGKTRHDWESKLSEIQSLKIKRIALFLSQFDPDQRAHIRKALVNSNIKRIPLVHARHDFEKEEFLFYMKRFKTKCFTIHESHFPILKKWKGLHRKLFLEFNYDDVVPSDVDMRRIGGYCIDLAHFKAAEERWTKDFEFIFEHKKSVDKFKCNHLNGYSYENSRDIHVPTDKSQFKYLKTLPNFIFGKYIGLEMEVPIPKQLEFKKEIIEILKD